MTFSYILQCFIRIRTSRLFSFSQISGKDVEYLCNFYTILTSSWASLVAQMIKNLPAMQEMWVGDVGLIPGFGRFPGEGNGYSLQYLCLENSMDRGTWWATVHGIANSQTQLKQPALALPFFPFSLNFDQGLGGIL